jgi:hypothetical protein
MVNTTGFESQSRAGRFAQPFDHRRRMTRATVLLNQYKPTRASRSQHRRFFFDDRHGVRQGIANHRSQTKSTLRYFCRNSLGNEYDWPYTRERPIPVAPVLVASQVNRNLGWPFCIQAGRDMEIGPQTQLRDLPVCRPHPLWVRKMHPHPILRSGHPPVVVMQPA